MSSADDVEKIAVIGMSGAFPGARNIDELWSLLCRKADGISTLSKQELIDGGEPVSVFEDPAYVPRGGFLEDAEVFDNDFFGFSPSDALLLDPQQRLFLSHSRLALEDSGVVPEAVAVPVGVFGGASPSQYWFLLRSGPYSRSLEDFKLMLSNEKDFIATRTSYKLNLKGPSLDVQTACSTGLTAISLACQSLLSWNCDLALAGAATVTAPRKRGYTAYQGMIASPTGYCRPFDAGADGTVFGEGVGVVCLKRLSEAVADGDFIYAVIDAVAMNNDGSDKVGFTAPSVNGQAQVIEMAQLLAGVEPRDIGYIEAHGTATPLGDPIEVQALTQAFRLKTDEVSFCHLGSVKANIGHLDAAAGIAAFIKSVLVVHTGMIPPQLHFQVPNPHLELASSPFLINQEAVVWNSGPRKRIAGVSSFGIGGTNVHAIVEEPPRRVRHDQEDSQGSVLLLTAKTARALRELATSVANYLKQNPSVPYRNLVAKFSRLKSDYEHRRGLLAVNAEGLEQALREPQADSTFLGANRVLFAFPGQGAQFSGMARVYYGRLATFTQWIDQGLELADQMGLSGLRELLLEDGFEEEVAQTSRTQPLLYLVEVALAKELISRGVIPEGLTGHSVGEFAAAVVAGALEFEDGLRLVWRRGESMQEAPPGAMVAVNMNFSEVEGYLSDRIHLCVRNTSLQAVLGGSLEDVFQLEQQFKIKGVESRRLRTSHAFHSPMMASAVEPFAQQVRSTVFGPLQIPMLSSVDGKWMTAGVDWVDYWSRQLQLPVRFDACVEALGTAALSPVVEVGPGRALSAFLRTAQPERDDVLSLLPNAKTAPSHFESSLLKLWERGVGVEWPRLRQDGLVLFPGYPFARHRFWPGAAAPTMAEREDQTNDRLAVSTPELGVSEAIRRVWVQLLGHENFDQTTNFFLCGADSFGGIQLLRALKTQLDMELTMEELMADPTIQGLAQRNGAASRTVHPVNRFLFPVQTRGSRPPLFMVAGAHRNNRIDSQSLVTNYEADFNRYFSNLIPALGDDQPLYGFRPKGLMAIEPLHSSVDVMAQSYVKAIKEVQPQGPYFIGGECVGGILALEIACQLEQSGDRVGRLFLLDTPKPSAWVAFREDSLLLRDWIRWDLRSVVKNILKVDVVVSLRRLVNWAGVMIQNLFPITAEGRRLHRAVNGSRKYMKTLLSHHVSPYNGAVTYLINRNWNRKHYILGWKREIGTNLEVVEIPGLHSTRMIKSGRRVGQLIRERIKRPQ